MGCYNDNQNEYDNQNTKEGTDVWGAGILFSVTLYKCHFFTQAVQMATLC